MPNCPYCSKLVPETVSRSTECPSCGRPLHCCKCCTFYSPDSHYGCRETIDEPVWDKTSANFCDYFRLKALDGGMCRASGAESADDKAAKSREALAKLFSI